MIDARITGLPDLKRELQELVPKLRVRAMRNALAAGARVVQRKARAGVPVISPSDPAVLKGHRAVGTVRKAISVRTSKIARRAGDVGVFVNVRPLKRSQIKAFKASAAKGGGRVGGAFNPRDPYYWQWLEFGRSGRAAQGRRDRVQRIRVVRGGQRLVLRDGQRARRALRGVAPMRAYRFLQRSAESLPEALEAFKRAIGPQINRMNRPKAPAP